MYRHLGISILTIVVCGTISAGNLRQISSREGISNNAVTSLCQDSNGKIWLGTCDGLNMWNGERIRNFPSYWGLDNDLSGNLVEMILPTNDGYFWVCTNYGLDLFDPVTRQIENHRELAGYMRFATSSSDKVLVITADDNWHFYSKQRKRFVRSVSVPLDVAYEDCLALSLDNNDVLTVFSRNGVTRHLVGFTDSSIYFTQLEDSDTVFPLLHASVENDEAYLVDGDYNLYLYDMVTGAALLIRNLRRELQEFGYISHIIRDGRDYLISSFTSGVLRLKPLHNSSYALESLDIRCGVFRMFKDKKQDIIWIGTDGQGLFSYAKGEIDFRSITFENLPYQLSSPVRKLFVDRNEDLWIATKGEGLIRIKNFYKCQVFTPLNVDHFTTSNSRLINNSVYAITESSKDILWIGHDDDGLNYYSYTDGRIHSVATSEEIVNVHDIYESSPDELLLTTGNGVYRLGIRWRGNHPEVRESRKLDFGESMKDKNLFFSIYPENDSTLFFANRGGGAVEYNTRSGSYRIHSLNTGKPIYNDIFCISRSSNGQMYFATGGGLLLSGESEEPHPSVVGATHGILEDSKKNLWVSSNMGLCKLDLSSSSVVNYGYSYGLKVIEYSDGAYFADRRHNTLLFGGINGFTVVSSSGYDIEPYMPEIMFNDITINDKVYSVRQMSDSRGRLILQPNDRSFTLDIKALDYINGSNYSYLYRIKGISDEWSFTDSALTLKDMPKRTCCLEVKYLNNLTGDYSPVYRLDFKISRHWWESVVAIIAYCILLLAAICFFTINRIYHFKRQKEIRMKELETQRREQHYVSKLNLFSNLTQELTIPLTMISAPCQRILAESKEFSLQQRYAQIIQQNVTKMQNLVYMFHQFRGEKITEREYFIELTEVSHIAARIMETFDAFATQNGIRYSISQSDDIIWPTDMDGISTILNNLLSNAFKHTPYNGEVKLKLEIIDDELSISVSNDSKGVDIKDIDAIFDRYRILDYFERKSKKGLSITGDLALAICHSIAERLQGSISVESVPNELTTFHVRLPKIPLNERGAANSMIVTDVPEYGLPARQEAIRYPFDTHKMTMLIINENSEISTLIGDMFCDEFNIRIFSSVYGVNELMKEMHPDIIVSDLVSKDHNNLEFIRTVKQSRHTQHIPIILLSTPLQIEQHIEGLESGADICITLPFNTEYMKASVRQLIRKNVTLKDYFTSSLSAYELTKGQLLHKEDVEFIEKMMNIITENLSNSEISSAFIAREMGTSVRNLYNRLETTIHKTPSSIIKECRLATAEHLLVTTKLSIDEILYKSGFANRGTFFKSFSAKYNMTPRAYRNMKTEKGGNE